MNPLPPETFFALVSSMVGVGSKPAEDCEITFHCGCGGEHSVLLANNSRMRGDTGRAFVLPCPEAGPDAALTLVEARRLVWRKRFVSVASTTIPLTSLACELTKDAIGRAKSWLQQCAIDLRDSPYQHDSHTGFRVDSETPSDKDHLSIAGFTIYNLLMWLHSEAYLADRAIVELRRLISGGEDIGNKLAAKIAYYERAHDNAGSKFYDSFVGFATKLLTGSSKNAGRLVVEGHLFGLLLPAYASAASALGDPETAKFLRKRNEETRSKIKSYFEL